jgi:hypothetical protein
LLVQATYSIRRLPTQITASTYSRRSSTVSTVRKSQASVTAACWRRNERQSSRSRRGAGGTPASWSTLRTSVAETSTPSLRSSADDPQIAPRVVLAREPQDQLAQVDVDRRTTGTPVRVRPLASDESPMPTQQGLRPDHKRSPRSTWQHPAEGR